MIDSVSRSVCLSVLLLLPCDASAERGYDIVCRLSARLSVCPSMTFRYHDHIRWNSSKIISRPNSLQGPYALVDAQHGRSGATVTRRYRRRRNDLSCPG